MQVGTCEKYVLLFFLSHNTCDTFLDLVRHQWVKQKSYLDKFI